MKVLFAVRQIDVEHLGLMTLAAVLREAGHGARVVEARWSRVAPALRDGGYGLVGFSVPTVDLAHYLGLAARIKARHPRLPTVMGGPHPTFAPEVIRQPGVDIICRGEGEQALLELVQALEQGQSPRRIQNLWVQEGQRIHKNPLRPPVQQLDRLPWPDRSCFPGGETATKGKMHVMVSRGCPCSCSYCSNPALRRQLPGGPAVRRRSVGDVLAEICAAAARSRPRLVMFEDDLFASSAAWTREFCQRYPAEVGIPFFCYLRPGQVTAELVRGLRAAGCVTISMGIETADPELRRGLLRRPVSTRQILRAARLVKGAGMRLEGLNIVGIPGGSLSTDLDTVRLNARCGVDHAAAKLLAPYPGTEVRAWAEERGLLAETYPSSGWTSSLRFSDPRARRGAENLRKLFGIAAQWPRLLPLIRPLVQLPLDRPFRAAGLLWEGYTAYFRLYPTGARGLLAGTRKYGRLLVQSLGRRPAIARRV
jgi:radical SAM superfamily enzyme YgiQ (UPF0313 family)